MKKKKVLKKYKFIRNINNMAHIKTLSFKNHIINKKVLILNNEVKIRIFVPKDYNKNLIVYLHGGGWTFGSINSYHNLCSKISNRTKSMVLLVDYPLSPEVKFPTALNVCYELIKELSMKKEICDISFDEITLIGDSAGGNLSASLSLLVRDKSEFKIDNQILIYPVLSSNHGINSPYNSALENGNKIFLTTKKMNEYFNLYVSNKDDLNSPYVCPILSNDLGNQPRTLIITAEFDLLRDEGIEYSNKLKEAGNYSECYCIKNTVHGFFNYRIFNKKNNEVLNYINKFLSQ